MLRIATWNVNSIRARHDRLLGWLERHEPDVLCLQELKCPDEAFPLEAVKALGYHAAVFGQKTYNGVALLSREPILDVVRGFGDGIEDPQARFILGTSFGVRIGSAYVPNGSELGSPKYAYKLEWLRRLKAFLELHCDPQTPLAIGGDYNIAPEDRDVANPSQWQDSVLFHETARRAFDELMAFGLYDAFRVRETNPGFYTWWDYRMLGFPKNDGLRIDHLLVTAPLSPRVEAVRIDRNERKGKLPSDHAPLVIEFQMTTEQN